MQAESRCTNVPVGCHTRSSKMDWPGKSNASGAVYYHTVVR